MLKVLEKPYPKLFFVSISLFFILSLTGCDNDKKFSLIDKGDVVEQALITRYSKACGKDGCGFCHNASKINIKDQLNAQNDKISIVKWSQLNNNPVLIIYRKPATTWSVIGVALCRAGFNVHPADKVINGVFYYDVMDSGLNDNKDKSGKGKKLSVKVIVSSFKKNFSLVSVVSDHGLQVSRDVSKSLLRDINMRIGG